MQHLSNRPWGRLALLFCIIPSDSVTLDLDQLLDSHHLYPRLLRVFNVIFTARSPGHICSGKDCCESEEACRLEMFGLLIELDLLLARDTKTPSVDDWGSAIEAAVCLWGSQGLVTDLSVGLSRVGAVVMQLQLGQPF